MAQKLTSEQRKAIYCVKHGHSKIVTLCFGYVSCARCDTQIGDVLGSVFNLDNYIVVGHVGENLAGCNCTRNYAALSKQEKKMVPSKILKELDAALKEKRAA